MTESKRASATVRGCKPPEEVFLPADLAVVLAGLEGRIAYGFIGPERVAAAKALLEAHRIGREGGAEPAPEARAAPARPAAAPSASPDAGGDDELQLLIDALVVAAESRAEVVTSLADLRGRTVDLRQSEAALVAHVARERTEAVLRVSSELVHAQERERRLRESLEKAATIIEANANGWEAIHGSRMIALRETARSIRALLAGAPAATPLPAPPPCPDCGTRLLYTCPKCDAGKPCDYCDASGAPAATLDEKGGREP